IRSVQMGRPREFDLEKALDQILNVFWKKGYEGASLSDLEEATGLKKASLYAAIGNKRKMYLAAITRYDETWVTEGVELLDQPGNARQRMNAVFQEVVDSLSGARGRLGCFLCDASVEQAPHDQNTRTSVQASLRRIESAFSDVLANHSPYDKSRKKRTRKAQELLAVYMGMRVLSKSGVSKETLNNIKINVIDSI
ncbi:TetR/AcrR family transcriptional regulator, partial [bacterium]|nr:TetR/AcrR family transcriptional regulator [bacterium]